MGNEDGDEMWKKKVLNKKKKKDESYKERKESIRYQMKFSIKLQKQSTKHQFSFSCFNRTSFSYHCWEPNYNLCLPLSFFFLYHRWAWNDVQEYSVALNNCDIVNSPSRTFLPISAASLGIIAQNMLGSGGSLGRVQHERFVVCVYLPPSPLPPPPIFISSVDATPVPP